MDQLTNGGSHTAKGSTGETCGPRSRRAETAGVLRRERVPCGQCGALDAACAACRSRGRIQCFSCQATGSRSCPDGDGTVQHRRCAGTGRTVTWTEGVITRTPSTGEVKLPAYGVPRLARQQVRERGTWTPTGLTDNDPLARPPPNTARSSRACRQRPAHRGSCRRWPCSPQV